MRKHLLEDFTHIYHIDMHGNVRQNPKLSGTTHNVFGIQVGVGITVAVRKAAINEPQLYYNRLPEFWTKEDKLRWLLENVESRPRTIATDPLLSKIKWQSLIPDNRFTWLIPEFASEYDLFIPIKHSGTDNGIFLLSSNGVKTNRDGVIYDFSEKSLIDRMQEFITMYNSEVDRYKRTVNSDSSGSFEFRDDMKWDGSLKERLKRYSFGDLNESYLRKAVYRPFTKKHLYFDWLYINRVYQFSHIFPSLTSENENLCICLSAIGASKPFHTFIVNVISDLHLTGDSQCFSFYVYDEDGSNRRENITDWALSEFRGHYGDEGITKWAIFYYVYGLLHHGGYRERYADSLKRELPRIPFAPDFWAFSKAGEQLAELHLNYEDVQGYRLKWEQTADRVDFRVEKMRLKGKRKVKIAPLVPNMGKELSHADSSSGDGRDGAENGDSESSGTQSPPMLGGTKGGVYNVYDHLMVNETLTLSGIPEAAFRYRLGNRSALEWVVDQYRIKTDSRSGIVHDPNTYGGSERYIVDLVEKVVQVSVETVKIVEELEGLEFRE